MADEWDAAGEAESDEDLGLPIAELRDLQEMPSAGFLSRLIGVLRRRSLGSQLVTLSWSGLGAVAIEFLRMLYSMFEVNPRDEGESD